MGKLDIDSIYRDIGVFGTIRLKHRICLFNKDSKTNRNRPYREIFVSAKSNGGSIGYGSFSYRSNKDMLILESLGDKESTKLRNSICITYDDLFEMKRIIKEALHWFNDPDIKNGLYEYEGNKPYKISDKYQNIHAIMYTKIGQNNSFIAIQPAIINDFRSRTGYPGVVIKCLTGVIGCCTITEFRSMAELLLTNLTNLYQISLDLLNHHMLCELIGG